MRAKSGEIKMPNKDGTGPNGEGPRTGRQLGNCKEAQPQPRFRGNFGRGRFFRRFQNLKE